jgi:uncharacterized membrane protein SpoIIM required for sporulation
LDVDSFIRTYEGDWQRLDAACRRGGEGLAHMDGREIADVVRLYLRASTNLTEVRSRYHDPALERHLNELVGRARQAVYSGRPRTSRGFVAVFGARYRHAIRETAPFILVAAALMVVVILATWLWVAWSPAARAGVIPPQAQDAIRRFSGGRDPSLGPSQAVAPTILFNNVQVAFLAFALGITLGIGTIYIVVQNAALLGVLAGAFQAAGHAAGFWALIVPHGLLELTAICISAGAGLRIGWAIIDPGDRSRTKALAEEAASAVMVVIGVIPAFIVAAAIEGFVTGTGGVPVVVQVTLGVVVSVAYVCFLFGFVPWRVVQHRSARTRAVTVAPPT